MKINEIINLAWRQLKERRLRTILTILAVAVGVTVIIALSAQTEGVKIGILSNIAKLGPNTIVIAPSGRMPITDADIAKIETIENVTDVIPMYIFNLKLLNVNQSSTVFIGISSKGLSDLLGGIRLVNGSTYIDASAPEAVVGNNLAYDQLTGENLIKVGQPLIATDMKGRRVFIFSVTGILNEYGFSIARISLDDGVFIPLEYAKNMFRGRGYNLIVVKTSSADNVNDVSETLKYMFGGRVHIFVVQQLILTINSITKQVDTLLIGIAGTSFIAAGLGTSNIMMISVLERIREIGILKALGMKNRNVMYLYLIQGLLVGILGGILGTILGIILSYIFPAISGSTMAHSSLSLAKGRVLYSTYTPIISPYYISIAFLLSIAVTLIASIYPSWRALKLSPVEALRYE